MHRTTCCSSLPAATVLVSMCLGCFGLSAVGAVEPLDGPRQPAPSRAQTAPPPAVTAGRVPVIVNQAADAVVNYLKLDKRLGQGASRDMVIVALRNLVDQYRGIGVSHIFWNVNYQRAAYRSDVWPSYWDVENPEQNTASWPRKYYDQSFSCEYASNLRTKMPTLPSGTKTVPCITFSTIRELRSSMPLRSVSRLSSFSLKPGSL